MGSTLMTTNKVTPITAAGEKRFEPQADVSAISLPVDASLRAADIRQDKPVEHSGHSGRTYRILSDGSAGLLSATGELPRDAVAFSTPEQLDAVTANWPMRRFVDVWNQLPGQRRVARFENRSVAVQRLWRAIDGISKSGRLRPPYLTGAWASRAAHHLETQRFIPRLEKQDPAVAAGSLQRAPHVVLSSHTPFAL